MGVGWVCVVPSNVSNSNHDIHDVSINIDMCITITSTTTTATTATTATTTTTTAATSTTTDNNDSNNN